MCAQRAGHEVKLPRSPEVIQMQSDGQGVLFRLKGIKMTPPFHISKQLLGAQSKCFVQRSIFPAW